MTTKISILIPTRKRPQRLESAIMSLVDLAESPKNLEFILGIDNDDTDTQQYVKDSLIEKLDSKGVDVTALGFERLGYHRLHDYLNAMVKHATGDWVIFLNDDAVMKSKFWDQQIRHYDGQFKCLAFDTHNHHPYSIWPIIPREWVEYLGVVSNHHMFDAVISQIAYMLDIMERTTIQAEHQRFDLVGGEADETAAERQIFEGNPADPRDINHINNSKWRYAMAEKLSGLLKEKNISTEFWELVKQGKQNPWEKLKANDINNQMSVFNVIK